MTLRELSQLRYLRREVDLDRERLAGLVRERPASAAHASEIADRCSRIAAVRTQGYCGAVCYGGFEAANLVEAYLKGEVAKA